MLSLTPRSLFAAVLALAVALLMLGGNVVWNSYRTAIGKAENTSRNLAIVLDQHAAHCIDAVDQRLQIMLDLTGGLIAERRDDEAVDRAIARITSRSDLFRAVALVDAEGRIVSGQDTGRDIAALDYFARFRDGTENGPFIGTPVRRPADGSWELPVSRAARAADGRLIAVAVAYVDPAAFDRFYATLDLGEDGVVAVARTDGTLLLRHPALDVTTPPRFDYPAFLPERLKPGVDGNYQRRSPVDGKTRIIGFMVDPNLPFSVFVGINQDTALADWRRETAATTVAAMLLAVFLVLLGWRLKREMTERARGFADLERQAAALAVNTMQLDMARHTAEEAEERLRDALDALGEGFLLWDSENWLVLCDDSAHALDPDPDSPIELGQSFAELLDDRLERGLIPIAVGHEAEYRAARLAAHAAPSMPIEFETVDGRTLRVIERRTTEGGIVTLRTDVTAQRRLERALIDARQEAEAGSRAKSEFLASMSHELRTPLNAVIGFAELIHGEMLGNDEIAHGRYREYAGDIRDSGSHLLALINDILDFSKSEAGGLQLSRDAVDLAELVDSAVRMLKPRAERAGVQLDGAVPPNLPPIRGDGMRLRQILLNLMSNAIKYTPEDGRVTVSVEWASDGVLLKVEDTGIGIAPEDLTRVLEPFRQIENDLNRQNLGTGLGLPLTKRLVELHNGVLELRSVVGEGTTAVVRLPADRSDAAQLVVAG